MFLIALINKLRLDHQAFIFDFEHRFKTTSMRNLLYLVCFFFCSSCQSDSKVTPVTPTPPKQKQTSDTSSYEALLFKDSQQGELWELVDNKPFQIIDSFDFLSVNSFPLGGFELIDTNQLIPIWPENVDMTIAKKSVNQFRTSSFPVISEPSLLLDLLKKEPIILKHISQFDTLKIWTLPNDLRLSGRFETLIGRGSMEIEKLVYLERIIERFE